MRCLQEAKVLLLGDSRAFFTVYKAIVDVGLKPFQLDRDETLLKAGLPAEELKEAAEEAATAADCLLVTHQQLASLGFPFDRCKGCAVLCRHQSYEVLCKNKLLSVQQVQRPSQVVYLICFWFAGPCYFLHAAMCVKPHASCINTLHDKSAFYCQMPWVSYCVRQALIAKHVAILSGGLVKGGPVSTTAIRLPT